MVLINYGNKKMFETAMKKLFVCILFCACSLTGMAQTFVTVNNVRYLIEDDHAVVARQDKELTGNIVIPASIEYNEENYAITRLMNTGDSESGGGGAFQECEITGITLPEAITEIPDHTFDGCKQLSSVIIQGPVTYIGYYAFESCESLTSIDLPDEVTEMKSSAFYNSGLTEFKIPAGVTRLEDGVLAETMITYLEIPENVQSFAGSCFKTSKTDGEGQPLRRTIKMGQRDCRLITFDDDPLNGKYSVPSTTFGDMTKIDLLVPAGGKVVYQEYFPWIYMNSITEYGEDTGEPLVTDQRHVTIDGICYLLKNGEKNEAYVDYQPETLSGEVIIPEQVTYEGTNYPVTTVMGGYAISWYLEGNGEIYPRFSGAFTNTKVTKVTLPASIKSIELRAFARAQNLQEVTLNEGITDIANYAFSECPELTTINIPSTVASLPIQVLFNCTKLKNLTLNEGLAVIDADALWASGLETLAIPSTCTNFGNRALCIFGLKTLYIKVKEPTDLKNFGLPINYSVFDSYEILENVDLIVPLGCAESYQMQSTWSHCRSVTDEGCPFLKLNNSVFSAPNGAFSVTNTENEGYPEFEQHDGDYEEAYTHGLCLKEGTAVSFSTTAENSQVYVYLFSNNNSTVKLDDTEMTVIGDDQSNAHSYRRYDMQVGAGEHIITCSDYEGEEWPCMFLLQVKDESGEYYHPREEIVSIDGIRYHLEETVNEQDETVRTATVARQKTCLSGDIVIPEKVTYAKKVLQGDEWVTQDACDYDVTAITLPAAQNYATTYDGAFQDCQITSITVPATITAIPVGAFNGCQQLKNVTLPETIESVEGSAFANCTSLEEIYLPESIKDMGMFIFWNCSSLKKVNIPKQVTILGLGAFLNSGIETFIIPENITYIDDDCFATYGEEKCLKSIKICRKTYSDGNIHFPESMFNDVSGITLIVPEGTKESLYSQVYPWKNFDNIIEYKDQEDEHLYNAYNVSYEEEVIGHEQEASDDTTILDYVPSGVDTELPEDTEKEDYVLIGWHDKQGHTPHTVMPAQDILLRLTLALLGDANRDGDVDVSDFLSVANYILGRNPVGFLHKAANTSKGDNEIDVADFLGVANVILRGVHYRNPHHAPARRTASNTDISTMDNAIYVEPASLCVGLEQTLSVKMKNVNPVAGFEFCLQLPEGITVTGASLSNERTTSAKTSSFSHAVLDDGTVKVLCGTMTQNPETGKLYTFDGNDGEVATITISIDPNMTLGNYSAIVTNAKLADADAVKTTISSNVESVITVSDVLVLDENSTMMPPTANGVTVTVRRTIKANEWSTICLPFDMTEEQVKAAFGNDVQLAEFSSYDAVKDGDNVTSITINFEDADLSEGFYGNYPYIIKTSSDITEFTLTANVVPDDAVAEYTNGKTGSKKVVYGSYIGTYKAKTVVPENCLFLSSNKFWYSAGLTKMKAFRAYFDFLDILSEVENANARITMSLDNQTEGIKENLGITPQPIKLYDLQGRLVKKPGKGLYIQNGRKVIK